jgi:protein-disulfide isomerase
MRVIRTCPWKQSVWQSGVGRAILSLVLISSASSLFCQFAEAQQQGNEHVQEDISAIKTSLNTLHAAQQEMLNQLNDIKRLIAANSAARPASQPLPPPSNLAIHDEPARGDGGAQIALIEYADFECPYCGQYEREVFPQLFADYIETGKIKYFYRDLPLEMHPHAMIAARAARCAGEQGRFWEMHDSLFAKQNLLRNADMPGRAEELGLDKEKFAECLSSNRYTDEINQSASEAHKMGINGTPTFFVGKIDDNGGVLRVGKVIMGARPYEDFKSAIDVVLASKAQ